MKINLQGKNIELTLAISDHVLKQITNLEKLLKKIEKEQGEEMVVNLILAKTSNHHKTGEIFRADCSVSIKGNNFYSSVNQEDLYQAINLVKENLFHEIQKKKDSRQTLFKRGAASVKKMLKSLSNRNPFTSKY